MAFEAAIACDFGQQRSTAAGGIHNVAPSPAIAQKGGDGGVAGLVFGAPFIEACCLGFGRAFRLPATPILIVLASDRREHIQHHGVDGCEHPASELVGGCRQVPGGRQVERHDPNLLGVDQVAQLEPVG